MKTILSLDLGITSIGYSVLKEIDIDRYSLVDYGVNMFDKATDKDGKSKKLLHSSSTSASKLINLRKERRKNLARLFENYGFGDKEYFLYQEKQNLFKNKWELRAKKVFKEKLTIEELFSIFYTISKHRGYKSLDTHDLLEDLCKELNLDIEIKSDKKDDEKGKIKQALKAIENLKVIYPSKTVTAIIYEEEIKKETPVFRNHDNYKYIIRREDIVDEIRKIIASQEKHGLFNKDFQTDKFCSQVIKTIDDQKESTNDENLFANCEFYNEHKVSHQYSLLTDIYKMYQSVSNITFNKEKTKISKEQIKIISDDFFAKIKKGKNIPDIKYKEIRKLLNLDESIKIFDKEDSTIKKGQKEENRLIKFHFVSHLSQIDNSFILEAFEKENPLEELRYIFDVLGFEKSPKTIYERLKDKINSKTIIELIKNKSGKSTNVSSYAMTQFIPYFEQGYTLSDIKKELNISEDEDYGHYKKGIKYLSLSQFEQDDNLFINNHPVKYVVSAALRLVKHLHSSYGPFDEVRVESTRELSLSDDAKKEIEKVQRAFEKEIDEIVSNEEYQKIAQSYGKNLRKYARRILMWLGQDKMDIYTGKSIGISDIFTNVVDIDHIIPQSLGGLSVKHNTVLAHRDSNLQKSNRLPMDFISDKKAFENRVEHLFRGHKINWKKKINLLASSLDETFKDTFESKELRATSYIEALMAQVLKRYYPFPDSKKQSNGSSVCHIQGRATANIRKALHVRTKTRDSNIHHAIDAILIGLTNRSWIQKLSNTFRENYGKDSYQNAMENIKKLMPLIEGIEPKELVDMIEGNYSAFGDESVFYKDIWGKTKTVNFWVSKKPMVSKVHKDTIYAKKEDGIFTVRENLKDKFISLKATPTTATDVFMKGFKKEILSKMYLYRTNPNDAVCKATQQRANRIVELLKEFMWLDVKDKEAMSEAKIKIDALIHSPVFDNNSKEIRKVQFYQTNLTGIDNIRGGLAVKEKTFIGFKVTLNNDKLNYGRIDVSNTIVLNGIYRLKERDNSFQVYKNDLVFFIYPDGSFKGGKIVSFLEDKKMAAFSNPRFPASISSQPYEFLTMFNGKANSHKQHSIGKSRRVVKINLDILGNIKSYQAIGDVQSEFLDFIKIIKG